MNSLQKLSYLFLFLNLCFFSNKLIGQNKTLPNSFIIHGVDLKPADITFFSKSIEAADFEQFRLQTETVILKFTNGFTLELISAKDLVVKNIQQNLDINNYSNYPSTPNYKYPLFEILNSGWVTASVETTTKN